MKSLIEKYLTVFSGSVMRVAAKHNLCMRRKQYLCFIFEPGMSLHS